jgi:MFS transporter, FHS family, glucose/mannose:H+ symporter
VMAIGLGTVNSSSMAVTLLALVCLGLGYGLVVPPTNLTVAQLGGARSTSLVSLVNFAWGAGAVSCSPLVRLALKSGLLPQFLVAFATLGALLTFGFFFAQIPEVSHGEREAAATAAVDTGVGTTIILAALFFLYVGIEVSLGSWAAEHAKRLPYEGASLATIAPMFFYGGLMTGRAMAPRVLARVREYRLVLSVLALVLAGNILLVLAANQSIAFVSLAMAGLGCAAIFPIYVAWLSRWYGARANQVSGIMFSMSSVGSAVGPWLVGLVSAHLGGLRVGLLVPLFSAVVMLVLLTAVRRQATA